jgi:hypothetical protein
MGVGYGRNESSRGILQDNMCLLLPHFTLGVRELGDGNHIPTLIVACRLITSGVNGVNVSISKVSKLCVASPTPPVDNMEGRLDATSSSMVLQNMFLSLNTNREKGGRGSFLFCKKKKVTSR